MVYIKFVCLIKFDKKNTGTQYVLSIILNMKEFGILLVSSRCVPYKLLFNSFSFFLPIYNMAFGFGGRNDHMGVNFSSALLILLPSSSLSCFRCSSPMRFLIFLLS